jgi:RNA 3'-terminal phosphate cyclase (ATP)
VAAEHLTDQLLLRMALAEGGSFSALKINLRARTMKVITKFLPVRFTPAETNGLTKVELTS